MDAHDENTIGGKWRVHENPMAERNGRFERDFGARIRGLRKERGWSQEELARRMGVYGYPMHQVTVGKIENAVRPTSVGELGALAAVLEVDVRDLLWKPSGLSRSKKVEAALAALDATRAELASLDEQINQLTMRRARLRQERDVLLVHYHQVTREENDPDAGKIVMTDSDGTEYEVDVDEPDDAERLYQEKLDARYRDELEGNRKTPQSSPNEGHERFVMNFRGRAITFNENEIDDVAQRWGMTPDEVRDLASRKLPPGWSDA